MFDARALRPIEVAFPNSGVFVLESHHTRGFRMAPVAHGFLKIVQPFAGRGWIVRGDVRLPLNPGDVVLLPSGERHHIEDDGAQPLSLYALCLTTQALSVASASAALLRRFRYFPTPVWSPELRGLIRHLLHEQTLTRAGTEMMTLGLALQALGHVARAANGRTMAQNPRADQPARARVDAYVQGLKHSFYQRQSVDEVSEVLGMSRRHFTQLFRELTGKSWLTVLQQHRLNHARRLLRTSDRSITSIGYESGFEDITTFYRAFKAAEGMSPLSWRNKR